MFSSARSARPCSEMRSNITKYTSVAPSVQSAPRELVTPASPLPLSSPALLEILTRRPPQERMTEGDAALPAMPFVRHHTTPTAVHAAVI